MLMDYPEAMRHLCAKIGQIILPWKARRPHVSDVLQQVLSAREHFDKLVDQFEQSCMPIQPIDFYQRKVLRLHTSYSVSYLCRPALIDSDDENPSQQAARAQLLRLCNDSLITLLQEYVDLLELSNISFRVWSLIYNGRGASLILGMLGELRRNRHARLLVQRLLDRTYLFDEQGPAAQQAWRTVLIERLSAFIRAAGEQEGVTTGVMPDVVLGQVPTPDITCENVESKQYPAEAISTVEGGLIGYFEAFDMTELDSWQDRLLQDCTGGLQIGETFVL